MISQERLEEFILAIQEEIRIAATNIRCLAVFDKHEHDFVNWFSSMVGDIPTCHTECTGQHIVHAYNAARLIGEYWPEFNRIVREALNEIERAARDSLHSVFSDEELKSELNDMLFAGMMNTGGYTGNPNN